MDADEHPAQSVSSCKEKIIMDQDLSNETSEDSDGTFYTRWVNAIVSQHIKLKASANRHNSVYSQWLKAMNMLLSEAKDSSNADVQTVINQT